MRTADLANLDLLDVWYEHDATMRVRVKVPSYPASGTEDSAVVSFKIEPGCYLDTHTDSAEEILLMLAGTVEASLGDGRDGCPPGRRHSSPRWCPTTSATSGMRPPTASMFDQRMMPFGQRAGGTPAVESVV